MRCCRKLDSHSGDERKRESISILVIIFACLVTYKSGGDSIVIDIMMILVDQDIICNSRKVISMVTISQSNINGCSYWRLKILLYFFIVMFNSLIKS